MLQHAVRWARLPCWEPPAGPHLGRQGVLGAAGSYGFPTPWPELGLTCMPRACHVPAGVLQLWEGFETTANQIVVLGATNKKENLDDAVLRRFSLQYEVRALCCAVLCCARRACCSSAPTAAALPLPLLRWFPTLRLAPGDWCAPGLHPRFPCTTALRNDPCCTKFWQSSIELAAARNTTGRRSS